MHKTYGNNGTVDPSELDPCLAAESRMKHSVLSDRMKMILIVLSVLILLLIVVGVLLLVLGSNGSMEELYDDPILVKKEETGDSEPFFINDDIITTPVTVRPPTVEGFYRRPTTKPTSPTTRIITTTPTIRTTTTVLPTTSRIPSLIPVEVVTTTPIPTTTTTTSTTAATTTTKWTWPSPTRTPEARRIFTTQAAPTVAVSIWSSLQTMPTNVPVTADIRESCLAHRHYALGSGIYTINPDGRTPFYVFCDMETDGGGWTVIQRRLDEKEDFHKKTFKQYEEGFGNLRGNHWLGLAYMHRIAPQEHNQIQTLRIELRGDTCMKKGCSGQNADGFWWGEWDFSLGGRYNNYTLRISPTEIRGNMTNPSVSKRKVRWEAMSNGQKFTAWEVDNDENKEINCAQFRNFGGWWHKDCTILALNGKYGDHEQALRGLTFHRDGEVGSYNIKPRQTLMMIRPTV